ITAGATGNASVVWYQYDRVVQNPDSASTVGKVYVYQATLLGQGTRHSRVWTVNASGRPIHEGGICQGGTTCVATGQDRRLGDYLTDALDARGCVMIATGDTMSPDPVTGGPRAWSLPVFMQQTAGPSLTRGTCGASRRHGGVIAPFGRGMKDDRTPALMVGTLLLGLAARSRRVVVRRPSGLAAA